MIRSLFFLIVARATAFVVPTTFSRGSPLGTATMPRPRSFSETKSEFGGNSHVVVLFDDMVNTREYVSRILCTKVDLSEAQAYEVMMTAHQSGSAVRAVPKFCHNELIFFNFFQYFLMLRQMLRE